MRRVQLDVDENTFNFIESVMKSCNLKTKTKCIVKAIEVLNWASQEKEQGRSIVSIDKKSNAMKEILF